MSVYFETVIKIISSGISPMKNASDNSKKLVFQYYVINDKTQKRK